MAWHTFIYIYIGSVNTDTLNAIVSDAQESKKKKEEESEDTTTLYIIWEKQMIYVAISRFKSVKLVNQIFL